MNNRDFPTQGLMPGDITQQQAYAPGPIREAVHANPTAYNAPTPGSPLGGLGGLGDAASTLSNAANSLMAYVQANPGIAILVGAGLLVLGMGVMGGTNVAPRGRGRGRGRHSEED